MSKVQRPEEGRGTLNKLGRFFNFGKNIPPEERMLNTFKEDFSKTENGVIVITLGPSRCGKSTLLNFLTVKDYPLLNKRGWITKKAKEMMYFKAQSGEEPCTADFSYKKIKASEFMAIHGLELPDNFVDYDIFFIDTEGFSTIKGISDDLFLGIFTLLSGVSVQIYLDITPMSNADRVKSIAQNIAVSRFLGSEPPKTISISRGGALTNNNKDGDDDDEDDDDTTYNDKLYKEYRERDKKNKPIFISALKEEVVVDEDKVEILTIPRCDVPNGVAYKNTVKDLAKMILNCATPCNGKVLLNKIEDSYNKVCNCSESLTGKITLGGTYVSILKDYCIKEIEKEEKNVENEFKKLADNKSYDEIMEIRSGKDSSVNALFGEPYSRFMKSFEKIIPRVDALDGMTVEFLKNKEKESKEKMRKTIIDFSALLCIRTKDYKGSIYFMYKANPFLGIQGEANKLNIFLIDENGKQQEKTITVNVSEETFKYNDGEKDMSLRYIFPTGLKVTKTTFRTESNYTFGFGKQGERKVISTEDITKYYYFNFISNTLFPKDEEKYTDCTYSFNAKRSFLIRYAEVIEESQIEVSVPKGFLFKIKNCECIKYLHESRDKEYQEDFTLDSKGTNSVVIKADSHTVLDRTNIVKVKAINFS